MTTPATTSTATSTSPFLSGLKDSISNLFSSKPASEAKQSEAKQSEAKQSGSVEEKNGNLFSLPLINTSSLANSATGLAASATGLAASATGIAASANSSSGFFLITLLLVIVLLVATLLFLYPQYQNKDKLFALFGYGAAPVAPSSAPSKVKGLSKTRSAAAKTEHAEESEDEQAEGSADEQEGADEQEEDNKKTNFPKSKAGYCYIGDDDDTRKCIEVGEADKCMSGDIFPTRELCINPKLR
jgi:hypothetical protein